MEIIDYQNLLTKKEDEIATLQEKVAESEEANEKLTNKINKVQGYGVSAYQIVAGSYPDEKTKVIRGLSVLIGKIIGEIDNNH